MNNTEQDTITLDIPLFIRVLELAREDIKTDADLHRMVERVLDISDQGTLSMDQYDFIAGVDSAQEAHQQTLETIRNLAGIK